MNTRRAIAAVAGLAVALALTGVQALAGVLGARVGRHACAAVRVAVGAANQGGRQDAGNGTYAAPVDFGTGPFTRELTPVNYPGTAVIVAGAGSTVKVRLAYPEPAVSDDTCNVH